MRPEVSLGKSRHEACRRKGGHAGTRLPPTQPARLYSPSRQRSLSEVTLDPNCLTLVEGALVHRGQDGGGVQLAGGRQARARRLRLHRRVVVPQELLQW